MASYGPKYFSILFLVALLFPTFDGFDQHFGFAAGSVALRLVIMLLVLWFLMKFNFTIRFHSKAHVQTMAFLVILFSVFLFLVIWSLGNNISEVIMRDIFELHRPFYYAMLLMFPLLFRWSDYEIEKYVVK